MSKVDIAKVKETIATPADSFMMDPEAFIDSLGFAWWRYTWCWNKKATIPQRISIIILTMNPPMLEDDRSQTVYYSPARSIITVGGEKLECDRYVGRRPYWFNYETEKPELAYNLPQLLFRV
jgi:hypothetical protein